MQGERHNFDFKELGPVCQADNGRMWKRKYGNSGWHLFAFQRENVVPAKAGTQVRRPYLTRRRGMSGAVYAPAITGSTAARKGP